MQTLWWIADENGRLEKVGRHMRDGHARAVGSGPPNPQIRRKDIYPLLWPREKAVKVQIILEDS